MTPEGDVTPEALLWLAVDVSGSLALLVGAAFAVTIARVRPWPGRAFWIGAGVGMAYLAGDERFSLHERIGRWLYGAGVPNPPGVNHMDDAVLLAIAAAAFCFSAVFIREILASRQFAALYAVAAAVTTLGLTVDAAAPVEGWVPRVEEVIELGGQVLVLCALAARFAGVYRVEWRMLSAGRMGRRLERGTIRRSPER